MLLGDVQESVLLQGEVAEGTKGHDVAHHRLQNHARLQAVDASHPCAQSGSRKIHSGKWVFGYDICFLELFWVQTSRRKREKVSDSGRAR